MEQVAKLTGKYGPEALAALDNTSDVLPILHELGVDVVDERPYEITPAGRSSVWIYDFGLLLPDGVQDSTAAREAFEETFLRAWRGQTESDSFNHLVLHAGLSWREVSVVRAYSHYLAQTTSRYRQCCGLLCRSAAGRCQRESTRFRPARCFARSR